MPTETDHRLPVQSKGRHLRWAACYNVRDLGGHATIDGGMTRIGAVVRADSVGRLTEQGCAAVEAYGIRTIIDLRAAVEVRDEPSPFVEHAIIGAHHLPLNPNDRGVSKAVIAHTAAGLPHLAAVNAAYLATNGAQIAAIMRAIADAPEGGVLFHCHAGRDRTGLIAALLLGVAGVPTATIITDYTLSFGSTAETMEATLGHVESAYGGIGEYLRTIGLTDAEIVSVRRRLRADE